MKIVSINNKEINYLIIDTEKALIKGSGEDLESSDTFLNCKVDLNSLVVGNRIRLSMNGTHWVTLNYKITKIEEDVV
jgi:hypothetical protein